MSLVGRLEDLALPDIFQIISLSKKTGTLVVRSRKGTGMVAFKNGQVIQAGSDVIRIGLIGCGGRGTEAALNAMNAGKDIRLVALADIFRERLDSSRKTLQAARPDQVEVKDDRCFIGFGAYQQLLQSGVDVVLIAACSHFHPAMLEAAVTDDIAVRRLQQAVGTGAEAIISSCQQCKRTLLGAARKTKTRIKILDIAELVWQAMEK